MFPATTHASKDTPKEERRRFPAMTKGGRKEREKERKKERGRERERREKKRQVFPSYEQASRDTPKKERGDPECCIQETPRKQRKNEKKERKRKEGVPSYDACVQGHTKGREEKVPQL